MFGQRRVVSIDIDDNTDDCQSTEDEFEEKELSDGLVPFSLNPDSPNPHSPISDSPIPDSTNPGSPNSYSPNTFSDTTCCENPKYGLKEGFKKAINLKEVNISTKRFKYFNNKKCSDLSQVFNISKKNIKLTKNDLKTKEPKISEALPEPLASSSKLEPKTNSSDQNLDKTGNKVWLNSNPKKNKSKKTRYYCHPKHSSLRTGVSQSSDRVEESAHLANTVTALIKTSTTFQTMGSIICKNCGKSFESKEDFEQHFNKFHSKQNLPKIFNKLKETSLLSKQTIKVSINQSTKEQEYNSFHSNAIPTHSSALSSKVEDNGNKSSKQKNKKISKKIKSKSSKHCLDSTDRQSSHISSQLSTKYCYQKCKLCALVHSLETIDKHILNVHHDQILIKHILQNDMSPYRSILVVKTPIDLNIQ